MEKESTEVKKSRYRDLREWLQLIIISFAAIWGAYEFIVKDLIRPAQRPTALELNIELEQVGREKGNIMVRAGITAKNPTDRRIYVPALWYTVRGYQLSDAEGPVFDDHKEILGRISGNELISTYSPIEAAEIVAQQRITYDGNSWWEPEDKTRDEAIFAVPRGNFDFLELRVYYLHTRDDSKMGAPIWSAGSDGGWDAQFSFQKEMGEKEFIEWSKSTASGYSWSIATLALW